MPSLVPLLTPLPEFLSPRVFFSKPSACTVPCPHVVASREIKTTHWQLAACVHVHSHTFTSHVPRTVFTLAEPLGAHQRLLGT